MHPYKRMTLTDFSERELLVPLFKDGVCVYDVPTLRESKAYCKREMDSMWDEYKRILNPNIYKVDLSDKLYDLKTQLLNAHREPEENCSAFPALCRRRIWCTAPSRPRRRRRLRS